MTAVAARARAATRRTPSRSRPATRRRIGWVVLSVLVAAWALLLRPTALGGPATYVVVSGTSMQPTLWTGDLVVLRAAERYDVGDVVTYPVPEGSPGAGDLVIHRITGGDPDTGFTTRGDNRDRVDDWTPTAAQVRGREWLVVPHVGTALRSVGRPPVLAALAGGIAVVVVLLGGEKGRRDDD